MGLAKPSAVDSVRLCRRHCCGQYIRLAHAANASKGLADKGSSFNHPRFALCRMNYWNSIGCGTPMPISTPTFDVPPGCIFAFAALAFACAPLQAPLLETFTRFASPFVRVAGCTSRRRCTAKTPMLTAETDAAVGSQGCKGDCFRFPFGSVESTREHT
jgi:hypothetical protein